MGMPEPFVLWGDARGYRHRRRWRAATAGLAASLALAALAAELAGPASAGGNVPAGGRGPGRGPAFGSSLVSRQLLGVSCVSSSDCWAVGGQSRPGVMANLIEHWDGTRWAAVPSPAPPRAASGQLTGISCASAADCWATGLYVTRANRVRATAEHWNGKAWQPARVAQPPQQAGVSLTGVSCTAAQRCVSVGSSQADALAETWNGAAWSAVPSPHRGTATVLSRVSCAPGTGCWAAGYWSTLHRKGSLTEHWDGSRWSAARNPTSRNTHASLAAVSCAAAGCMAVGVTGTGAPLAERLTGSAWALTSPAGPPGASWSQLDGVSCAGSSACMAVGSSAGTAAPEQPLAEQWNGTGWSVTPVPATARAAVSQLSDVSCVSASDCWAVGSRDMPSRVATLIEHWNGTAWSRV
jgi:hypothetical protein